jgi:argininosuccinate lyase
MGKNMKKHDLTKLWGSAFMQEPGEAMIKFTAGRDVAGLPPADAVLLPYDLWVNNAHCVMLAKTGIIPASDAKAILEGLNELENDKSFVLDSAKEDVHTNIESYLTNKLGIKIAGKLHTARSRNDQIVTDMKLYMRDQVGLMIENSLALANTLLSLAESYKGLPFPGFSHHQHAMVTTFGHVLAGFASMVIRDIERLQNWFVLHNFNSLGNVVSYGTTFPINKKMTSEFLGFDAPDNNSLDAITNRWEPEADLSFAITILMNHLSLISETLILLATPEFSMITLADQFSTGSSIMPQKKNPDPLEVIKGKTGFAQGQLMSLLSMGKGNFIGYNRDSQWTKYIIMDVINECLLAPIVLKGVLETCVVHKDVMESWCHKGLIGSTTVMEQIIQESHISMREAKIMVEKMVKEGSNTLDPDPISIIAHTKSYGGPGKNSMKTSLKKMKQKLQHQKLWLLSKQLQKEKAKLLLKKAIDSILKGGEKV